jgi:hypothetical protein
MTPFIPRGILFNRDKPVPGKAPVSDRRRDDAVSRNAVLFSGASANYSPPASGCIDTTFAGMWPICDAQFHGYAINKKPVELEPG